MTTTTSNQLDTRPLKVLVLALALFSGRLEAQEANRSLLFDGSNDLVRVPHNSLFNIGNGFTVEAWINASEWKSEVWAGNIVSKDRPGPDSGFAFRAGKSGSLNFVMSVDESWFEVSSAPLMPEKVWAHVAAVVEGDMVRLYINANEVARGTFSGSPVANTNDLIIGESSGFSGRVFNGFIDEVRIWNDSRTQEELRTNYSSQLGGDEEGLIAYYGMNEGSGTMLNNLATSASGLDGTLENFDTATAWGEGFELPINDVGVLSLVAPDLITAFERPTKVKVRIQNFGFNEVSNIPVGYVVDDGEKHEEVVAITLAPGETYTHTFNSVINLVGPTKSLLRTYTGFDEDINALNNEISTVFDKPGGTNENKIIVLNKVQHNFGSNGQTQFAFARFPDDLTDYSQILMNIRLDCPTGGCDPWDQPAKISIVENGEDLEIARYITPFGIGTCAPWTIDVTDFKDRLAGLVRLKSFIQVWGSSGWLLTVNFEFIKGDESPVFKRSRLIWGNDYLVYGDPNISHDIEEKTFTMDENTTSSHIRMIVTGHGQANTDNAAEFSDKTHRIVVNGETAAMHHLFKADCEDNPCSPQSGTWRFDRAGWCPGQGVIPFNQDITEAMEAGQVVTIDYELQDYTNFLNTDYNGSSHTEPHYRVWGYLVEESSNRFEDYTNLAASNLMLASDTVNEEVTFGALTLELENKGNIDVADPTILLYVNGELKGEEQLSLELTAGSSHTYEFSTSLELESGLGYEIIAVINHENDQSISDDAALLNIAEPEMALAANTNISEIIIAYPNPSPNGHIFLKGLDSSKTYHIKLYDLSGRLSGRWESKGKESFDFTVNPDQLHILTVQNAQGRIFTYKIVGNN
ncbi:MAG: hypothetical protein JXR03_20040 [Cyclobacteriaceae bacterium]